MFLLNKKISQKFAKLITKGTLIAFLLVTFLGIFGCMCAMAMDHHEMKNMSAYSENMADCPTLEQSATCSMSITEHLILWQSALTADANFDFLIFLEAALGLSIAFSIFKIRSSHLARDYINRYRSYLVMHQGSKLYNYLLRIFSQGILQPKLFA